MTPSMPNDPVPDSVEVRLVCQVLRDEYPAWPAAGGVAFEHRFLHVCREHGVAGLVHHRARLTPAWRDWPADVRAALGREATMRAALDMLREEELIAVLAHLATAGIRTVLLKGTPLAHSHYAEPALRPRCDTDVLIPIADREAAACTLEAIGYRRENAVSGRLVSYQACFHRKAGSVDHVLDMHWRINNSQLFARALRFDAAYARSVAVPRLGPWARALCPPHALLLACMHRASHLHADGGDGNRLIWLYDIHLLATALSAEEWQQFAALCAATQTRRIGLDAFAATHTAFATAFPAAVVGQMAASATGELSAQYLNANRWRLLLTDLRGLATWRDRATLLRESCFPPAEYMLARYHLRSGWRLPWWYARRAIAGAWKYSNRRTLRRKPRLESELP